MAGNRRKFTSMFICASPARPCAGDAWHYPKFQVPLAALIMHPHFAEQHGHYAFQVPLAALISHPHSINRGDIHFVKTLFFFKIRPIEKPYQEVYNQVKCGRTGEYSKNGEKLVTAGKDVTQKAKDLSGTAKLNLDIKAKEDFIEKQYAQIGKLYYEDHKDEADGAYGQQMQAIAEAFASIDHMKEEVLKIKGARQCPQCGATVPEDTEFCGKCGAKLNIFED